jgi:hypothetical protein
LCLRSFIFFVIKQKYIGFKLYILIIIQTKLVHVPSTQKIRKLYCHSPININTKLIKIKL